MCLPRISPSYPECSAYRPVSALRRQTGYLGGGIWDAHGRPVSHSYPLFSPRIADTVLEMLRFSRHCEGWWLGDADLVSARPYLERGQSQVLQLAEIGPLPLRVRI